VKQLVYTVCLVLLTICFVVPAGAWEFSLAAQAEWRYRYISRTGPGDLFGNAQIAQATPGNATSIGLAGPQTMAVRIEGYSSKGSDAAYAEQRFFLYPDFVINPAIRLRAHLTFQGNANANYRGGGANWVTNPHYSGWTMIDSRDLYVGTGLSVPILRAFWATGRLPWGTVTIGTRPAVFGMGWGIHEDDSYARSLALIVPYGPLSFVFSQYLHDAGYQHTDPNDDRNTRKTVLTIASGVDQNEVFNVNTAVAVRYAQGNLDCGSLLYVITRQNQHVTAQPAGTYQDDMISAGILYVLAAGNSLDGRFPMYIGDDKTYQGMAYVKYMNGRFFLNGEYDFQVMDINRNGGRPIAGFGQAWAAEVGMLSGPAKLSLAHFYRSGHDRRGGIFALFPPLGTITNTADGTTAYVGDKLTHYAAQFLGAGDAPVKPYCFILSLYGTGNNSYTSSGVCTFEDFLGNAARIDYAAAANLNVFASFMQARRASNTSTPQGYFTGTWGLGFTGPDQANNPGQGTQFNFAGVYPMTFAPTQNRWYRIPNVPDNDLGWEVNAGFDWKLLEGMTWKFMAGYWQPGKWFNWAYQDMSVSRSDASGGLLGRVKPERTINPIMAIQMNLLFEF
jgi:hypothetical protein